MQRLHGTTGAQAHPVTGILPAHIARIERVAGDAVTLWLAAPGATRAPAPYLPGQYITLALTSTAGALYRSYSLSSDGRADRPWEITVKRQRDGAVSSFLCERATPDMLVYATPPRGAFTLPQTIQPNMPLVFVAAGAGIAPIYGMLRALALLPAERRPQVQLHYASGDEADVIYGPELAALDPRNRWLRQWYYLSARGARLTPELALAQVGAAARSAQWYICGPSSVKRGFQGALAQHGIAPDAIHVEVFGGEPSQRLTRPGGSASAQHPVAARLRLAGPGAELDARHGETILDALERNGYSVESSCRAGTCGACRLRVLAGQTRNPGDGLTATERAAGYVLSCVAEPVGDVTLAPHGIAFQPQTAGLPAREQRRRATTRLRWAVVAACVSLFLGLWRVTQQASAASANSNSGSVNQNNGGFGNDNGPSGVNTRPGVVVPNTGSGVSK